MHSIQRRIVLFSTVLTLGVLIFAPRVNAMGRKADKPATADPTTPAGAANTTTSSATGAGTAPAAGGIVPVGGPASGNAAVTGAGNPVGIGNSGAGMSGAGMGTGGSNGAPSH